MLEEIAVGQIGSRDDVGFLQSRQDLLDAHVAERVPALAVREPLREEFGDRQQGGPVTDGSNVDVVVLKSLDRVDGVAPLSFHLARFNLGFTRLEEVGIVAKSHVGYDVEGEEVEPLPDIDGFTLLRGTIETLYKLLSFLQYQRFHTCHVFLRKDMGDVSALSRVLGSVPGADDTVDIAPRYRVVEGVLLT